MTEGQYSDQSRHLHTNPAPVGDDHQAPTQSVRQIPPQNRPRIPFEGVTVTYPHQIAAARRQANERKEREDEEWEKAAREWEKEWADRKRAATEREEKENAMSKVQKGTRAIESKKATDRRGAVAAASPKGDYDAFKQKQARLEVNNPGYAAYVAREREANAQRLAMDVSAQEYHDSRQNQSQYGTLRHHTNQSAFAPFFPIQPTAVHSSPTQQAGATSSQFPLTQQGGRSATEIACEGTTGQSRNSQYSDNQPSAVQYSAAAQFDPAGELVEEPIEMAADIASRFAREFTPLPDDPRLEIDRHWMQTAQEIYGEDANRRGIPIGPVGGSSDDPTASYGLARTDNRPVQPHPRPQESCSSTGRDRSISGSGYDRSGRGNGSGRGSSSDTGTGPNNSSADRPAQNRRGTGMPVDPSVSRGQTRGRQPRSEGGSSRSRHTSQTRGSSVDGNTGLPGSSRGQSQSPHPGSQRRDDTSDSMRSVTRQLHAISVQEKQGTRTSSRSSSSSRANSQDPMGTSRIDKGNSRSKTNGSSNDDGSKFWKP